jgi:hypothetical protein
VSLRSILLLGLAGACVNGPMAPGWFRADLPPENGNYEQRFAPVDLSDCVAHTESSTVIVLMHGAVGDGNAMKEAIAELMRWGGGPLYMMRWSSAEPSQTAAERLSSGLSRLASCLPDARVLVLSHSAAGIIAARAAHDVHVPGGGVRVFVLTVGAPLAGIVPRPPRDGARPSKPIFQELGRSITEYPEAAPGVRVVHLRTSQKSDLSMTPFGKHHPNETTVGVPGARQIDLPESLTHEGALVYVVRAIIDGRVEEWLR